MEPGHDAVVLTSPAGSPFCNSLACRRAGRLAEVIVTFGWIVLWLAPKGQFRAYRRLPGARHDTILSADEPGSLASQMEQAEQAARLAARRPKDRT
jgi:hypothetical protein